MEAELQLGSSSRRISESNRDTAGQEENQAGCPSAKTTNFPTWCKGGGVVLVDSGRILFCSHNFVHQDAPFIIFKHWPFYFYKRFLLCCLWVIGTVFLLAKDQPVI